MSESLTSKSPDSRKALAHGGIRGFVASPSFQSTKVWALLGVASFAFIVAGHRFGDRFGLLSGFLLALALNALVVFYANMRLASLFHATELEGRDPWGLLATVRELSTRLQARRPNVYLISTPTPITYSAGLLPSSFSVFVSEELLNRLTPDEVRAVIAYELIRLKNHQTGIATTASALAGLIAIMAWLIDQILFLGFILRRQPPGPAMVVLSPLVALVIRLGASRRSYFDADEKAAELIGNPATMARALWKLESYVNARPIDLNLADSQLFIVNPARAFARTSLFHAQPSVKQRITNLVGHYPL